MNWHHGHPHPDLFQGREEVERVVGLNNYGTLKNKLERVLT